MLTRLLTCDLLEGFTPHVPVSDHGTPMANPGLVTIGPHDVAQASLIGDDYRLIAPLDRQTQILQAAVEALNPALWRANQITADTPDPVGQRLTEQTNSWEERLYSYLIGTHFFHQARAGEFVTGENVTCHYLRTEQGQGQGHLKLKVQVPKDLDPEDLEQILNWIKTTSRYFRATEEVLGHVEINGSQLDMVCELPELFVDSVERFISEYRIALELMKIKAYESLPDKDRVNKDQYDASVAPFIYAVRKAKKRFEVMEKMVLGSNFKETIVGGRILDAIHNGSNFFTAYINEDNMWREDLATNGFAKDFQVLCGEKTVSNLLFGSIVIAQKAYPDQNVGVVTRVSPSLIARDLGGWFDQLQNIMVNLISNSIKYGGSLIQIQFDDNDDWDFFGEVADDGIGMTRGQLKKYGTEVWQADDTMPGKGIGAQWVKKTVADLGGSFDIQSKLRVGTTVRFSVPGSTLNSP